jgi:hypothetical protein
LILHSTSAPSGDITIDAMPSSASTKPHSSSAAACVYVCVCVCVCVCRCRCVCVCVARAINYVNVCMSDYMWVHACVCLLALPVHLSAGQLGCVLDLCVCVCVCVCMCVCVCVSV